MNMVLILKVNNQTKTYKRHALDCLNLNSLFFCVDFTQYFFVIKKSFVSLRKFYAIKI